MISSVPRIAGHIPPVPGGATLAGIGEPERNCQLMAVMPLWITVTITKTSGTRITTKANHMTKVAIWFFLRRQPACSLRSTVPVGPETAAIRPPSSAAPSALRSRGRPG